MILLLPYISSSASEVAYYWQYRIRESDIEFEKPDAIVLEIVQRHIPLLIDAGKALEVQLGN